MELKPGYKQTDAGVIPDDWESTTVRGIASTVQNAIVGGPFGSDLVSNDYVDDGVPVIRGQNMGCRLISGSFVFVTEAKAKLLEANLARPGDLVFTQRGTLGQVSLVPNRPFERYLISQSQMKLTVNRKATSSLFFFYVFSSSEQQEFIRLNTIQTGVPHINLGILRNLPVQRPSLAEQEAIAGALSDADALIESLEQIIAKKRGLKQGAMQELLTGKKRLPGFNDKWERVSLGELFTFKNGLNKAKEFFGYGTPIVNYMDVFRDSKIYSANLDGRVSLTNQELRIFDIKKGDVLFTRTSETANEIGMASVVLDEPSQTVFSGFVLRARPKDGGERLRDEFKAYCFRATGVRAQIISKASYTTRALTNGRILSAVMLSLPEVKEQTAIATILSDMDAELAALEAKLAKARDLKEGMMQELLTGRIRLVGTAVTVAPLPVENIAVAKPAKAHNWQINEAVVVSVLVKHFGSEQYPLARKRCTKLCYLLHRHVEHQAEGYLKKAAGPYNPAVKYKGPEGIAQKNGYVRVHHNGKYPGFIAAQNIAKAEAYFQDWYGADALAWLVKEFKFVKTDELELFATVDMAMEDLRRAGKPVEPAAVKQLIHDEPEWAPKLDRAIFSDANIARALARCRELFQ